MGDISWAYVNAIRGIRFCMDAIRGYIKQNQCEMMNYLKEEDQMPFINLMAEKNYFSKEGIEAAIDWASRKQKTELLSILMNEQHKRFPKKKKTFEL